MAMRIAAFAGTNSEFREYLEAQRTAQVFTAVRGLKHAIDNLRSVLPGITSITHNGSAGLQIYFARMDSLDEIPGTPEIKELQDKSYYAYQLAKEWLGVKFVAFATANEVKPVLSGEDIIRKMVEEVAGNEAD